MCDDSQPWWLASFAAILDLPPLPPTETAWYPWLYLAEDGIYGPATEAAVKELQRRAAIAMDGTAVDGIAGPATFSVLRMS